MVPAQGRFALKALAFLHFPVRSSSRRAARTNHLAHSPRCEQRLNHASWSCALWCDRGFEGTETKKTRQRNREADLINEDLVWEPWAFGCLEGPRVVQQRCQWIAEKAGVTSALGLHDATNAYLSLHHGSANEAAHWLVLKETDRRFLDPRISHAVVNIADEETAIDLLAGSRFWPGDCCAPRIVVKDSRTAFTLARKRLEELGRCSAHRVKQ